VLELENFRNEIRTKFPGHSTDEVFLVTTSRLVVKNGVEHVIKALASLPRHVKFLVIGAGPLARELERTVRRERAEERVIFLGEIPHKDLSKYLKISDIFLRPSLSEGMGNSFIEAMAAGLPVIATNVGGIPDFLKEGETGVFCEVENPQSIAEKVESIMNQPKLRETITTNASKLVREKYDWNLVAKDMSEKVLLRK
jgi:glycosyltransferase involved in cell wall biosynthesis